jgi:hypothetical protein
LPAHGRWLSPGTLASSTTKTGRHDIAEILLKVALKHQQSNQDQSLEDKYLDLIFRQDLKWKGHLNNICTKADENA